MFKTYSTFFISAILLTACATPADQSKEPVAIGESINTVEIEDKIYKSDFEESRSAYQLMVDLQTDGQLTLEAKDYGDLGFLIEEINGIKNSNDDELYWIYYINNEQATMGASQYILEPNDAIAWKYEAYE